MILFQNKKKHDNFASPGDSPPQCLDLYHLYQPHPTFPFAPFQAHNKGRLLETFQERLELKHHRLSLPCRNPSERKKSSFLDFFSGYSVVCGARWFWDSNRGSSTNPNPFHFWGSQNLNHRDPNQQLTICRCVFL